jgi:hypothetical protein
MELIASTYYKTFDFPAFLDILQQITPGLDEPCEIFIDLSRPFFFGATGMVPLIALIDDLAGRSWRVQVAPPNQNALEEYWTKAGWLQAILGEEAPFPVARSTFTPLSSYANYQQLNRLLNVLFDLLAKISEFPTGVLRAVEWTINELADNVLVHSGGARGWMQAIARPKHDLIDIVVTDRGLGVLSTLREGFPDLSSDQDALELAIEQGVTRNSSIGAGNGLAGSIRIAREAHGYVNVLSGTGLLRLFHDGTFHQMPADQRFQFDGTVVTITLPTGQAIDLAEALWGSEPTSGFEFTHLTESGVEFKVLDEATGFGNRGSGEEVATKLRNIMNEFPQERVLVDFAGIDTPSASFVDEFLAKLAKEQGVATFFGRVSFINMNDFVRKTADAMVAQRLSQH